ncbi:MAG: DEAD/DEAH box helicase, partial [Erysipelotrichaceae bacterium]|nr:DEAD/DEAH box helicase [Erysipelotrichaceae bacterium]
MKTFQDFNLNADVLNFIHENNFEHPTKIQEAVINEVLKHKSVIAISDTGTGKTHAFLIPLFNMIDPSIDEVQAVITAPTRELALQIYNRAKMMQQVNPAFNIRLITGGIEKDKMSDSLKKQPHMVIGTPGRIKDLFLQESILRVDKAKIFVVDEADMTLEFGFLDDVDAICSRMGHDLQMLAFSATIPQALRPFLKKYMANPQTIQIKDDNKFNPRIEHVLVPCKHKSYAEKILDIL